MKKVTALALTGLLVFSMSACGGNNTPVGDNPTATPAPTLAQTESNTAEGTDTGLDETTDPGAGGSVRDFTPRDKVITIQWGIDWWESLEENQYIFDEFTRRYPDYTIDNSIMAGDMNEFIAACQAGNQPDLWMGMDPNWAQFATGVYQGVFSSLNEYLEYDPDFNFSTVNKQLLDLCKFVNGQYYAVPYSYATYFLAWNKELFAAAGLDPEKPPTIWTEFYEYAKTLTKIDSKGEVSQLGYVGPYGTPETWILQALNGFSLIAPDLSFRYDDPSVLAAQQFSDRFTEIAGEAALSAPGINFKQNNAAMVIGTTLSINDYAIMGANLGIAPLPVPDDYGKQTIPTLLYQYIAIPKGAKNPDGGWLFMKYGVTDLMFVKEGLKYQNDPVRYVPEYIPHQPTREKSYAMYLDLVDDDVKTIIQARDELMDRINFIFPNTPLQQRGVDLGAEWNGKFANNEVSMVEMYKGLNTQLNAELAQWKRDLEQRGWQFPEGEYPIPPDNF